MNSEGRVRSYRNVVFIVFSHVAVACWGSALRATAEDGKQVDGFRGDARRAGVVLEKAWMLPLRKVWERDADVSQPAWPERSDKLSFDWYPVPVIDGERAYIGSSLRGAVDAFDLATGKCLWTCYADGPVRFAPLVVGDRVYFVSDDGRLYCVSAKQGNVIWSRFGGPSGRIVLGNEHYISAWPARGAPVYHDGTVYFAAGIWPWMGIFIHAVDAESGEVVWTNSGEGAKYTVQQHNSPAFAGIAPQGYLATDGRTLIVPGGLTVPGLFDLETGDLLHFDPSKRNLGKDAGGYDVVVGSNWYINHGGCYDLETGRPVARLACDIMTADAVYTVEKGNLVSRGRELAIVERQVRDRKGKLRLSKVETLPVNWSIELPRGSTKLLAVAGNMFLLAIGERAVIVERDDDELVVCWEYDCGGAVTWADCRGGWLTVATEAGKVVVFSAGDVKVDAARHSGSDEQPGTLSQESAMKLPRFSSSEREAPGFGLVVGGLSPKSVRALLQQSRLHWTLLVSDRRSADRLRSRLDRHELLGERLSVRVWGERDVVPPYTARTILIVDSNVIATETRAGQIVQAVRPYGGTLWCHDLSGKQRVSSEVAELEEESWRREARDGWSAWRRPGPLPRAGRWTHQNGNAANTLVSPETRVRLPLGLLWYGGPSNREVLPRHGHGPTPQVLGGRILIEGPDMLRALDVYSGVLLWQASFPGLGDFYNTTSHHPGAGAIGGNYVMSPEAIYVIYRRACYVLDPASGKTRARWELPPGADGKPPHWGHVAWSGDVIVAAAEPVAQLTGRRSRDQGDGVESLPYAEGSRWLYGLDRRSGKVLWKREARWNFRHNAIAVGGGRVFCIDAMTSARRKYLDRRGVAAMAPATLYALDLLTGKVRWEKTEAIFGTWLAYHEGRNMLLEGGSRNRDRAKDEAGRGMAVYDAESGNRVWHHEESYAGPPLLFDDRIVAQGVAFDWQTGKRWQRRDPLTGELVDWFFRKNYGCDTAIGCPNLLTFRSAAAGFFDLALDGGTGNFGGFRTSCTANLIPADGVVAAPDYTRTCVCSYQQRTSLALVPMPELPYWTFLGAKHWSGRRIERLGVNFGAPGDRREEDGTLWLEYPVVGGDSPRVPIRVEGRSLWYPRSYPLQVAGEFNWVAASGVEGAERVVISLVHEGDGSGAGGGSGEVELVPYRVELWFAELGDAAEGERVFSVRVGGKVVRVALDVRRGARGAGRSLRVDAGVHHLGSELRVELRSTDDSDLPPVLSGVKLVRVTGEEGRGGR